MNPSPSGGAEPGTRLHAAERELVALVDAHRQWQCEAKREAACSAAAALLRQARADARAAARRAFSEARQRRELRLAAATAEAATRRRLVEQHRLSALLAQAMRMLPDALAQRWQDPAQRASWVAQAVAAARKQLPAAAWEIRHAPGLTAQECAQLAAALPPASVFLPDASIRAGLRIGAPPNVVDGTLEGSLADRAEVEAQLLAEIDRRRNAT